MSRYKVMKEALEKIANPIKAIQEEAKASNCKINGAMAVSISNDAEYLKGIARDALREVGRMKR